MQAARNAILVPRAAMVLAAGKGLRMRPLTETRPKPLVELAGKTLLDHALDAIAEADVERAVINVHYLGEQIVAHVRNRKDLQIAVSDERDALLDTGGGIVRALPLLGGQPFYLVNSDTVWREGRTPALYALSEAFDAARMDAVLLLIEPERGIGYDGPGDFVRATDGRLARAGAHDKALVYMGVALVHPRLFAGAPAGAFSLNLLFDHAIAQGRLYGIVHDGDWMHVGTPAALAEAEAHLAGVRA